MHKKEFSKTIKYSGKLGDYQLKGNSNREKKRYMQYERDPYSEYQNFLYRRALYGLAVYTPEEVKTMHWEKKRRIQLVHEKAQHILNIWKQEIVNHLSSHFFKTLFPNCQYIKRLIEDVGTDPTFKNSLTFKELGIGKDKIIDKLIEFQVLPTTFKIIKTSPVKIV